MSNSVGGSKSTGKNSYKFNDEDQAYLDGFERSLQEEGVSVKTLRKHMIRAEAYLEYLEKKYGAGMLKGTETDVLEDYFGNVLQYNTLVFTASSLQKMATSLRKFFKYAANAGYITAEKEREIRAYLKNRMKKWTNDMKKKEKDDIAALFFQTNVIENFPHYSGDPNSDV